MTNVRFDVTHTEQAVETDYHNFRLNYAPLVNLTSSDPVTEWNGVNLDNRTLERTYSRSSSGFFNRTEGEREITTDVASLELAATLPTDSAETCWSVIQRHPTKR